MRVRAGALRRAVPRPAGVHARLEAQPLRRERPPDGLGIRPARADTESRKAMRQNGPRATLEQTCAGKNRMPRCVKYVVFDLWVSSLTNGHDNPIGIFLCYRMISVIAPGWVRALLLCAGGARSWRVERVCAGVVWRINCAVMAALAANGAQPHIHV